MRPDGGDPVRSQAAALGAVLALSVATLTQVPAGSAAAPRTGGLRVARGPDGYARFVAPTGSTREPGIGVATPAVTAARTHLERYGAVLGLGRSRLLGGRLTRSVTGDDVVRFRQRRGGLPVVGGAVAVDLRSDRQLGSLTASVSHATVPGASYPSSAAASTALALARRDAGPASSGRLHANPPTRWLYDPAVLGVPRTPDPTTHARGVWRVVVHGGPTFRRLVLVDDRTGAVVQDADLVEAVDRVVCDNANDMTLLDVPCIEGFARTEADPASAVPDVNQAFDLAGVVSTFYAQVGGIDLTQLLGVPFGGARHLSSTVRYCDPFQPPAACPLSNAFWNGVGMFYGDGFASADDVVGHEMTHGVISRNADLLYFGQSGAMNESLADVMGEIVDHRNPGPGDTPTSWTIGEDLPIGAIRDLSDPHAFGQPQSMTDRRYTGVEDDNGGVHTDSGVGNRTFYLISQGGGQAGQVLQGIDAGDPTLTKTATLALGVIQHLVPGSDYADLAAVLDQTCADLAGRGVAGFTAADCDTVHRATLATRLRETPHGAPQPKDAPLTCPQGAGPVRVLFDSEHGKPTARFHADRTWMRAPNPSAFPAVPANAVSGHDSWFSVDADGIGVSSLRMHAVPLPVGRPSYLWFQQWRVLDFGTAGSTFDAGTVEVGDATAGGAPVDAAGLPWRNGPRDRISDISGNPAAGRLGFGKDSFGWVASRASFHRYAGHAVQPQFSMNTDNSVGFNGWYLDDVRVYTCGSGVLPTKPPRISGKARVGHRLTASPGTWTRDDVDLSYQWFADGRPRAGATGRGYHVGRGDDGMRITVRVTGRSPGHGHAATFSPATARVNGG